MKSDTLKRTKFDLRKVRRAIVEGLISLQPANIDEIIKIIKKSKDTKIAWLSCETMESY